MSNEPGLSIHQSQQDIQKTQSPRPPESTAVNLGHREGTMAACVDAIEQQIVRGEIISTPSRDYGLQSVLNRCTQNPIFVEAITLLCTAAVDTTRGQATHIINGIFRQSLQTEALQAVDYMMQGTVEEHSGAEP